MSTPSQVKRAMRARTLVRFNRRFEDSSVSGYVVDVGPRFFLLALVSDRIRFDGFEVLRIADVRRLRADPERKFIEHALKLRKARMPRRPRLDMSSVAGIVESAGRSAPLISICNESEAPDVCYIGRLIDVQDGWCALLKIQPSARWDRQSRWFSMKGITRVCFGGDYEDALYLVGGEPSTKKALRKRKPARA